MRVSGIRRGDMKNDVLLFPVCNNDHWTLVVIHIAHKIIFDLDSCKSKSLEVLLTIAGYYTLMDKLLYGTPQSQWQICKPNDLILQRGRDCGVHVCLYSQVICTGKGSIPDRSLDEERTFIRRELSDKSYGACDDLYDERSVKFDGVLSEDLVVSFKRPSSTSSTLIYLRTLAANIFKSNWKTCINSSCLGYNEDMVFCYGCHDWYHTLCFVQQEKQKNFWTSNDESTLSCSKCSAFEK